MQTKTRVKQLGVRKKRILSLTEEYRKVLTKHLKHLIIPTGIEMVSVSHVDHMLGFYDRFFYIDARNVLVRKSH